MSYNEQISLPEFLKEKLFSQYGEELTEKIRQGYLARRRVSLRLNPLKGDRNATLDELNAAGLSPEPVSWYRDAFTLSKARESDVRSLKSYEDGRIYMQSLSSMLPPLILSPKPDTDILDMAAAPGGKTTQIAALCGNKCRITACERNAARAERLRYNIAKQGVGCAYVMLIDSRQLNSGFSFDSILLDAPCSGSGTLTASELCKSHFTNTLIKKSSETQRALLTKALELLKPGHKMVYSTCSILAEENEDVVGRVLSKSRAEIVKLDDAWLGELPLLPVKLPGTVCVCPDADYEGFFIAKLRKLPN